jgi:hypothetical protein
VTVVIIIIITVAVIIIVINIIIIIIIIINIIVITGRATQAGLAVSESVSGRLRLTRSLQVSVRFVNFRMSNNLASQVGLSTTVKQRQQSCQCGLGSHALAVAVTRLLGPPSSGTPSHCGMLTRNLCCHGVTLSRAVVQTHASVPNFHD